MLVDNLAYRPFGSASGMAAASGAKVENTFDDAARMTVANPGAEKERRYGYDAVGNHTGIELPNTPWLNRQFGYDDLDRLETANGPFGTIGYTYDKVGNRKTRTVNGQTETYTYFSGTNRLNQITISGSIDTFAYDDNGNITGAGQRSFEYNQNNRLVRVLENGSTLGEYRYNALGQRVTKDVAGAITVFHYDFDGKLIGESANDGTLTKEYIYRGENVLVMVDVSSQSLYHYQNDYLGQTLVLTDQNKQAVWEAEYLPFGQALVNANSSVVNNVRLPGQYYDAETELHYNYHRYYDPKTGRYLTGDPIGLVGGINLYAYASNNPVNWIDPWGLWTKEGVLYILRQTKTGAPIADGLVNKNTGFHETEENPHKI